MKLDRNESFPVKYLRCCSIIFDTNNVKPSSHLQKTCAKCVVIEKPEKKFCAVIK